MAWTDQRIMLIDTSRCIGCKACVVACKQWHQLAGETTTFTGSYQNPPDLSGNNLTYVKFTESTTAEGPGMYEGMKWLFFKDQCRHCFRPKCARVCPTGVYRTPEGVVLFNENCKPGNLKLRKFKDIRVTGTHYGPNNSPKLIDKNGRNFVTLGAQIGIVVHNTTDGCSGVVTAITMTNSTKDTLEFANGLRGGTDNDFDTNDGFRFAPPMTGLENACPYNIPRFSPASDQYVKCDFCYDRFARPDDLDPPDTKINQKTACEAACPAVAIVTGSYSSLMQGTTCEARKRLKAAKRTHPLAKIIGGKYGRTKVYYLLTDLPEVYGY